jgi:hypothetical protein
LRIGEITSRGKGGHSVIQYCHLAMNANSLTLCFNGFKHNSDRSYHTVRVVQQPAPICPIDAMASYLHIRGPGGGSLFLNKNKQAVSRHQFQRQFDRSCSFCNLPISSYRSHSLRIGSACLMAQRGFSDTQIRLMGRWKSDAFLKYVRVTPL